MAGRNVYLDVTENPGTYPFLQTLSKGGDPLHRMVFADWLEENGYKNAAHGQRWAAHFDKRPVHPGNSPGGVVSGWLSSDPLTGLRVHPHPYAALPKVFLKNRGMSNSYGNLPTPQRMFNHEQDFLGASTGVSFDNEGNVLSDYEPGHPLHNTDTFHPV